jgi:NADH-quinone oxidoreductase subunit J
MTSTIPYLACVLGAAALYGLMLPRTAWGGSGVVKAGAAIVGLGVFGWLVAQAPQMFVQAMRDEPHRADVFFLVFSMIAVACAVRMITHSRPVYSALYFIMVVLSSAALFLMLQAEFMAFALVIVYAGAIIITYMFVIMLAQQQMAPSGGGGNEADQAAADYDRIPREPAAAAVVGFIMLALFSSMIFTGAGKVTPLKTQQEARIDAWKSLQMMPNEVRQYVQQAAPGATLIEPIRVEVANDAGSVRIVNADGAQTTLALAESMLPNNVQAVGLDLVAKFPVSLELAGVILLMAMFGAVVLARKQIELGEDEVREAAGMRRLGLHSDEPQEHQVHRRELPEGSGVGAAR